MASQGPKGEAQTRLCLGYALEQKHYTSTTTTTTTPWSKSTTTTTNTQPSWLQQCYLACTISQWLHSLLTFIPRFVPWL